MDIHGFSHPSTENLKRSVSKLSALYSVREKDQQGYYLRRNKGVVERSGSLPGKYIISQCQNEKIMKFLSRITPQ